jgi:hypothetical protein
MRRKKKVGSTTAASNKMLIASVAKQMAQPRVAESARIKTAERRNAKRG